MPETTQAGHPTCFPTPHTIQQGRRTTTPSQKHPPSQPIQHRLQTHRKSILRRGNSPTPQHPIRLLQTRIIAPSNSRIKNVIRRIRIQSGPQKKRLQRLNHTQRPLLRTPKRRQRLQHQLIHPQSLRSPPHRSQRQSRHQLRALTKSIPIRNTPGTKSRNPQLSLRLHRKLPLSKNHNSLPQRIHPNFTNHRITNSPQNLITRLEMVIKRRRRHSQLPRQRTHRKIPIPRKKPTSLTSDL